jgi:hypothetical protein
MFWNNGFTASSSVAPLVQGQAGCVKAVFARAEARTSTSINEGKPMKKDQTR